MIWAALVISAIVAGWYWHEYRWDRALFEPRPGWVCSNLSASQAYSWLQEHPETQVLDVRSKVEFEGGALPNAVNISISDPLFDEKVGTLTKQAPVLVYCAGGYRSRTAVAKLKEFGFRNIQHIHRGYLAWKSSKALPRD